MKTLDIFQVDAFTKERFKGNPAAVCILTENLEDKYLLSIAEEMNLSETAFVKPIDASSIKEANTFSLRWFTPKVEVPLCGHGTLATCEVIFSNYKNPNEELTFQTLSGDLICKKSSLGITLDFPLDNPKEVIPNKDLLDALGISSFEHCILGEKTNKLVLRLKSIEDVLSLNPDYEKLKNLSFDFNVKGLGVTAIGNDKYDFISRYFNPWMGINEDPVTGSVHTLLASYFGKILNKRELIAYQASQRSGEMNLEITGDRARITGNSIIVMKGEIYI
ncbi:PhzF family phenazine biosynthesis protein [Clostridium sp.]|uniref:PhzF family phenazine biosynthesis protein n=1 Tax=Clostridium sp. TaxID=1506 RepID=UPI003463C3DE